MFNNLKVYTLVLFLFVLMPIAKAGQIIVPMDETQKNHLKAYSEHIFCFFGVPTRTASLMRVISLETSVE